MDEGESEGVKVSGRGEREREREMVMEGRGTHTRRGDGGRRELERIVERNMATHGVKNNLSNYEERLHAFLSGMFYCTPPHIYISCIYLDAVIYCL